MTRFVGFWFLFGFWVLQSATPVEAATCGVHEDLVHLSAHVGTSYMITMGAYGAIHRWAEVDRGTAIALSVASAWGVGLLYKVSENSSWPELQKSMFRNSLGVGLAVGSVFIFQF